MKTIYRIKEYQPSYVRRRLRESYRAKYYTLFSSKWKIEGVGESEQEFIKRQYWENGRISCLNLVSAVSSPEDATDLVFAMFSKDKVDRYGNPKTATPKSNYGNDFGNLKSLEVGKDIVLGFANDESMKDPRGIRVLVDYYVDRIVAVEMTIHTNLMLHKLPFAIDCDPTEQDIVNDIIDQVMNDEIKVAVGSNGMKKINSFQTGTPYIIDKLYQYKTSLENEILTILGIDNSNIAKNERNLLDEVNANNASINLFAMSLEEHFKAFTDEIKRVFGVEISIKRSDPEITSIHNDINNQGKTFEEGGQE